MRLRRVAGSLLTLLTLHLNLLGADFACARHPAAEGDMEHGAVEHAMTMPATAASHVHGVSEATAREIMAHDAARAVESAPGVSGATAPCDVPVQPKCCKALASCNVVFSTANELDVAGVLNLQELIAPDGMTAPPSERAAPEPPPPKA